jgi:hypothetical protein
VPDVLEEGVPLLAIVPELVAEHAEGARGVAESVGHLMGLHSFNEERSEGFVLPVEWFFGAEEKPGLGGACYLITMIGIHAYIMLHAHLLCQHIVRLRGQTTRYSA